MTKIDIQVQTPSMSFKKPFRAVPMRFGTRYQKIRRRERWRKDIRLAFLVMSATFLVGIGALFLSGYLRDQGSSAQLGLLSSYAEGADIDQPQLDICGDISRFNCVVDGDTLWLHGVKIRVADIDTPEIISPRCDYEYELGMRATYRFRDLLNEGPFTVSAIASRDEDPYGRKLRVLTREGRSIGDMLVAEGLARTWAGRREPWC